MRTAVLLITSLGSLVFLSSCGGGGSGSQVGVTLTPAVAIVTVNQTTTFSDTVTGTTNTAVTWEVNNTAGGSATTGTISASGAYTAPAQVPSPAFNAGTSGLSCSVACWEKSAVMKKRARSIAKECNREPLRCR